ncbi:MAG: pyridoxal-dependent decarboxylase [Metamycoplasmataceae bacterium]
MNKDKKIIDFKALFLGSKSENEVFYKNLITSAYEDSAYWRKNFHAADKDIILEEDKTEKDFIYTSNRAKEVLNNLSHLLRSGSIPWHSPRYLGHMNSETLMPGIIAYFETMFFNGNNVAYESSPATSRMESEVGLDFCRLLGFDPKKGWGHISADGSVANYEGLWYARNFKSIPFAMKEVFPEAVKNKSDWELFNMSVDEIIAILDKDPQKWDAIKDNSIRVDSSKMNQLGKIFVPRTKHYSWLKAVDILGIGTKNIVPIDVDINYRMDVNVLEKELNKCVAEKTPILAVVSVVGTTEEGAIDHVDKVIAIREKLKKEKNVWFYYHIDAAYGGYLRSICLDENDKFIPFEDLQKKYKEYKVFDKLNTWPNQDIYNAFKAMGNAESITIDPHKMGYTPYSAGGIAIRDIKMRNAISYFATYVFDTKITIPDLLGAYIFEGSKAGATAAAVWTNHQVVPLNITGYGKLMGHNIEGSSNFANHINEKTYVVDGQKVNVYILTKPDFNIVDFAFNFEGNSSLEKMNQLNQEIYKHSSFVEGDTYINDLILSHTSFSFEDYKNAPLDILKRAKINEKEFLNNGSINILRSCILSPWLYDKNDFNYFSSLFDEAITKKLKIIISDLKNVK